MFNFQILSKFTRFNRNSALIKSKSNLINFYSTIKNDKNEDLKVIIQNLRNIGVIAHVDAGKTTTTERMLYYAGYTQNIGNVDDGNTIMDFMEQERERGITITSAAITFFWKNNQFNLIDTPGHVDFGIEVERALRVLDGAIAIIDASAGVEAQTLTVWKQSTKYKIPRIAYINKMDKIGANFEASVKSIEKKLATNPLILQLPIGQEKDFSGVIDLIQMKKLTWNCQASLKSLGKTFEITNLQESDPMYEKAFKHRINLIEKLAQINENFAEILLEKYNLNYEQMNDNILLEMYIRKTNLECNITPILCGSSYKNIGVQPLMDAIIKYLPNPLDLTKNNFKKYYNQSLCAVCFKIMHDHFKSRKRVDFSTSLASLSSSGSQILNKTIRHDDEEEDILSFIRVYSGELVSRAKVYNPNKDVKQLVDKIYIPFSNQLKQVNKVSGGSIAVVSGLTQTITGDFLVESKKVYESANSELEKEKDKEIKSLMRTGLDIPPPVFFCTVEPYSEIEEKRLIYALECLQREDPSLRILINSEENLGQTIIQGMGELQLEIIKDRILKEYKLKVFFGPLNISYKEMPMREAKSSIKFEKNLNDKKHFVQIELKIMPKNDYEFDGVTIVKNKENPDDVVNSITFPSEYKKAIDNGVKSALNKGIVLRYPIVSVDVHLTSFKTNQSVFIPFISTAAFKCTTEALKNAECMVIQPIMHLEISTPNQYSPRVYTDLTKRDASDIHHLEIINDVVKMSAKVPLSNLTSYSSELRKLTSGNTTFTIEFDSYKPISEKQFNELVEKRSLK